MLADNLRLFFPSLESGAPRLAFLLAMSALLTWLNYRGLHVVGGTAVATTLFILAPFVLLCALCAPRVQPANWTVVDWPSVQWGTFLNIMFWNLNYWDNVSTLAGEVRDPSRTFPRALFLAVLLVVSLYFFPTLFALGVMPKGGSADWELGYYGKVSLLFCLCLFCVCREAINVVVVVVDAKTNPARHRHHHRQSLHLTKPNSNTHNTTCTTHTHLGRAGRRRRLARMVGRRRRRREPGRAVPGRDERRLVPAAGGRGVVSRGGGVVVVCALFGGGCVCCAERRGAGVQL